MHRGVGVAERVRRRLHLGYEDGHFPSDEVFRQAERLAKRLEKSRSQLYREAVAEYVARHDPEAITDTVNRVAEQVDNRPDELSASAARRVLERTEW